MRLERTKEKKDGRTVYVMDGYKISFEKMTPGDYSNWNIEQQWYVDHEIKERSKHWGFKTLEKLKSFIDQHHYLQGGE